MQDVSEDDIAGFLGTPEPLIPEKEEKGISFVPRRDCPKCGRAILVTIHICPHCHTFIAQLKDYSNPNNLDAK